MSKSIFHSAFVIFVTLLSCNSPSWALPDIRDAWLAEYPAACADLVGAANDCSMCHSTGPVRNPYGATLESTITPTVVIPDFVAVELLDSDNDSINNLQEINNCTLPGGEPAEPGGEVIGEDADGNFVLDVGGDVFVQVLFSKAANRNIFVVNEPVTQPETCTVGSTIIDQCFMDTRLCIGPGPGGDFDCSNILGQNKFLGNFSAGTVIKTSIQVDEGRDGTIDHVFHSTIANNSDRVDHVRTSNLASGVWRLDWEDLPGGGDNDFNDIVVMIYSRPVNSNLGEADWRGNADLSQFRYLNNITVDPLTIPPNQRKLRLTQVITNSGNEIDAAFCAMLNFAGPSRPVQGYTYKQVNNAGDPLSTLDGIPDCNNNLSKEPSVRLTLDQMQPSPGRCPSSPPPTLPTGDIVTVPGASGSDDLGILSLFYEVSLAAIGDNLENESPEEIRQRALDSSLGVYTDVLLNFRPGLGALICPNGVDTWFDAAPDPEIANAGYGWYTPIVSIASPVEVRTPLMSSTVFGRSTPTEARLVILWEDNLETHLSGHLIHDPAIRTNFMIQPQTSFFGNLRADFPDDLPDGFLGKATIFVTEVSTGEPIVTTALFFAKDATAPQVTEAHTIRNDTNISFDIVAQDVAAGVNVLRVTPTIDGVAQLPITLQLESGNFRDATRFVNQMDSVSATDMINAEVQANDEFANSLSLNLPIASAGVDRTMECTSAEGASVLLEGSNSGIPPESSTVFTWEGSFGSLKGQSVNPILPIGNHNISLELEDERSFTGTDEVKIEVTVGDACLVVCDPNTPGAIIGTNGDDRLIGTAGNDVIIGLGGNDRIIGLGGNDCIEGGSGNDFINGIGGNNQIDGGLGNDHIIGGTGANKIAGGAGNDSIEGGSGADIITGGSGNDRINGASGDDKIDSGPGRDLILGGSGTDKCLNGERVSQCE
ncbi:MAG: DUF4114 domain-containing protein [Methylococcales bacterium]